MYVTTALFLILAGVVALLIVFLKKRSLRNNSVPGPTGIPFFGNTLQLIKSPHKTYSKWAYKFGDLYSIRLGRSRAVVISSPKAIREIFGSSSSVGLFCPLLQETVANGKYGLLASEGEDWAENRRLLMQTMKHFGCVRNKMGDLLIIEANSTVSWIKEKMSSGIVKTEDLQKYLKLTTNSSLWSMSSGKRLTDIGSTLSSLHWEMTRGLQTCVKRGTFLIPWLRHIFPNWTGYNLLKTSSLKLNKYIRNELDEHERNFEEGKVQDFMDAYIQYIKNSKDPNSTFYGEKGYQNTIGTITDIFYAGSETTSSTITWALIYLAVHPEVQAKLRMEIEAVIGNEEPTLDDMKSMPYLDAVVLELLRFSSVAQFGVIQKLLDDITYFGYILKKGTILIPNLYHVHHNKNVWGDPHLFRPERFIGEGGQQLKFHVLPFQAGRRSCPGESIARETLFLFLARIFQEFQVSCDPNVPREEYLKQNDGYLLLPGCHNLYFKTKS